MDDFHLLEDSCSVVSDQDFSSRVLDLECSVIRIAQYVLTILSIPRGPRLVLTTSATAKICVRKKMSLTFCGNDVSCSDVSSLFRF